MSYPMKLMPATFALVWGGTRLAGKWNKRSDADNIAESWELSCHEKGESVVLNGEFSNIKLSRVIAENPDFLGSRGKAFDFFPILIKLIDSKDNLSVQVHPSDEYALANEGEYGKTEMWYVVDCEEGSGVYCGFKEPVSKEELKASLLDGSVTDKLNFLQVKKGDTLFIEAGTVHAICGGMLICEVQQNSSITYRLYDYGRKDKDGKERELHVNKALAVTDTEKVVLPNENRKALDECASIIAQCKYFTVEEIDCKEEYAFDVDDGSFVSLTVVDGSGAVMSGGSCISLDTGDTVFIPAGSGKTDIYGNLKAIKAYC